MGHDHSHAVTASGAYRSRLAWALGIAAGVFVLEVVGAIWTGSLALIADAGHVLTDMFGVAFALVAATLAQRPPQGRRTFGWQRLEVIAAAANALLLIGVGLFVAVEGVRRLFDPPEVEAGLMLAVAAVGMMANFVSLRILTAGKDESLNVRGAYLEVLGDLLGSAAVVIAAGVIVVTGWQQADAVASLLVAGLILPRSLRLLREALRILLETSPSDVDLDTVRMHLCRVTGVEDVHDLHVWTITSGVPVLTAHVQVNSSHLASCGPSSVLDELQKCSRDCFGIEHTTFQLEPAEHRGHESSIHD